MKKFLSLVLALVMAMSLVTISASAADFKDEASIDPIYAEAVDVISALGIVSGNNGAFMPQDNLTRGAAAKILAGIKLGSDMAAKLPKTSSFSDVAAGSTFAGYISYLKDQGIVGGYGDGTFGPSNKLTGDAFLKQVLGVLGYKADIEGYNVSGWQVTVAIDALNAGLLEGMEDNFNSATLITREQAAQIILNALQADMVYYENQSSIQIGDVVINNSSEAKKVDGVVANHFDKTEGVAGDGVMQLAEKSFPTLEKVANVTDPMMRPATRWNYKGQELVLSVAPMEMMSINPMVRKDIYSALNLTEETKWVAYEDGLMYQDGLGNYLNGYNSTVSASDSGNIVNGNRRNTYELYYDASAATPITAILVNQYIGQVDSVSGTGADRTLTIVPMDNASLSFPKNETELTFVTEEFAEDDVVIFTYSFVTNEIQTIAAAESITGKVTKSHVLSNRADIYVDDVEVKYAFGQPTGTTGTSDVFNKSGLSVGDTVKVWLDSNSRYLYVEEVEAAASTDYAYVLDAQNGAAEVFGSAKAYAQLLMLDGSVQVVETKELYSDAQYDFVSYTINDAGQYVLADIDDADITADAAFSVQKGKIAATVNGSAAGTIVLNSASIILVKDVDADGNDIYTTFLGYENLPVELSGTTKSDVIMKKDSKVAAYIFVDATAAGFTYTKTSSTSEYLLINRPSSFTEYDDGEFKWYEFNGIVDGEVEVIKVAATAANKSKLVRFSLVFTEYTIDENGFYSLPSAAARVNNYYNADNTNVGYEYVDGIMIIGNRVTGYHALDEDVIIAYCNGNATYLWTVADLGKDTNDEVYTFDLDTDGDFDVLFINKK